MVSLAGNTVTRQRSSLLPSHVDALVFLNAKNLEGWTSLSRTVTASNSGTVSGLKPPDSGTVSGLKPPDSGTVSSHRPEDY